MYVRKNKWMSKGKNERLVEWINKSFAFSCVSFQKGIDRWEGKQADRQAYALGWLRLKLLHSFSNTKLSNLWNRHTSPILTHVVIKKILFFLPLSLILCTNFICSKIFFFWQIYNRKRKNHTNLFKT